jgi:hypothetical protein
MTTVYWLVKLRPGVSADAYQRFVQTVDYPEIPNIASIRSYRSNRVAGSLPEGKELPFDFIDVVEVTDLEAYLRDLKEHPAVARVHRSRRTWWTWWTAWSPSPCRPTSGAASRHAKRLLVLEVEAGRRSGRL